MEELEKANAKVGHMMILKEVRLSFQSTFLLQKIK